MSRTVILFLFLFSGSLGAQSAGSLVFSGSLRTRAEVTDWFQGAANSDYGYGSMLLRFGVSQQKQGYDWQIEFAAPALLGLPNDAISTLGAQGQFGLGASYFAANGNSQNSGMAFAKQAFIRFKRGRQSLRLGRFEFQDGLELTPKDATLGWIKRERIAQRLIGSFGWSDVGRSFDGAQYGWGTLKTNVTVLAAIPTRGAFQTDGWGELHTAFAYAALSHEVDGANASGDFRVFGIYYDDWRHVLKTDNRTLAARRADMDNIKIGTFGAHAAGVVKTAGGTFDALVWGAGQTGRWGRLDQRSGAILAEAGWQPGVLAPVKPWLRGGYSYTTGDDDPGDQTHGTFFQMLPTPRPYARFPFFNMMNNEDLHGDLVLRPHAKVTIRSEVHGLRLTSGNDLWYAGGGAFQPWTFGFLGRATGGNRGLATLYDTSVDVTASRHASFTAYFGHADGHSAAAGIYPLGRNANFGYLEMLLKL
ncbi:MAG: alginate export family protein [Acidobacteriota bacterium]|nr:alginate export family protein [Acidobacteriota bacterium]